MENNEEKNDMSPLNLKLPRKTKQRFKEISHKRGTTIQTVLAAFSESYISNPDKYVVKIGFANERR